MPLTTRTTPSTEAVTGRGRETVGAMSTVAEQPPWEPAARERPTWGLDEGDAIAQGRTVLRRLGGGRRYEVFLVWDEHRLSVLVAKVLRPDQAASPAAKADLRHEADVLGRLGHPVVVRGFDASVDGPFPHLLLEHLEGPTLQSLLERHGPLGLEQLLPLGLHVASALHYTAGEGFVHLDVKPENLVMGAPPRVIDFSVARSLEAAAKIARPIGTDAYMAPEQCGAGGDDVAHIGPPADVFGLGATLQYAMTGERAFRREPGARDAADPEVRFPQLTAGPEPLPRRTPPALAELIGAMLAFKPEDRPTAAEVAHALEPVVAELPRRLVLTRRGWRRKRSAI
jgi:serine/threonine protein kinase